MEEPKVHHDIDDAFDVTAEGFWPSWRELRLEVADGALVATDVDPQVMVDFEVPVLRLGIAVRCPEGYEGDRFTIYYSEDSPAAFDEAKSQTIRLAKGTSLYLLRFDGLVHHLRVDPVERKGATGIERVELQASRDEEAVRARLAEIAEAADEAQLRTIDVVMDPAHRDSLKAYTPAALRAETRARGRMRPRHGGGWPAGVEVVFDPQPNYIDPDTPLLAGPVTALVRELFGQTPSIRTSNLGELSGSGLTLCVAQTALTAGMERVQWDLPQDMRQLRNLCFLCAGSAVLGLPGEHGYEPSRKTRALLRLLFERPWRHGVRDRYTAELLASAGVTNFEIVGTPSLWDVPDDLGAQIPRSKGERVVFAADEYFHDVKNDVATMKRLVKLYDSVAVWPRNVPEPVEYAERVIGLAGAEGKVEILPDGPESLDAALAVEGTDYVGPNLEAGIRALKAHRRSLILASDDRSAGVVELAHLPAIRRIAVADILEDWILADHETRLRIPHKAIDAWKAQFR